MRTIWTHIGDPLEQSDDVAYYYFLFDNNFSKVASGDIAYLFDTRMFYPKTNTLAYGNSVLGPSILGLPVYLITHNTILAANVVFLLNFVLAYFFMYLLAWHVTGSPGGSAVAALIYTYNPYMMSRLHPDLAAVEWIPLLFLTAEMLLRRISWRWVTIGVVACIMQLSTSFYYLFFVSIGLAIYIFMRMKRIWPRQFVHPALLVAVVVVGIFAWWYMQPFLAAQRELSITSLREMNTVYSATLSDYFFTTPQNRTYGRLASLVPSLRGAFALAHPYEHSLFPGVVATVLALAGVWLFVKDKFAAGDRPVIAAFAVVGILAVILTFRMPYSLISRLPLVGVLRVPTRFVVLALLALSVIAAFVWKRVRPRPILFVLLTLIMCFEYRYAFSVPAPVPAGIVKFYRQLDAMEDIRVILELPIGNGYAIHNIMLDRDFIEDTTYLLWATFHHKTLVNGYHAFMPPDYYVWGRATAIDFPTPAKIAKLKSLGVDALVVHREEYPVPAVGESLICNLRQMGVREIVSEGTLTAFRL